MPAWKNPNLPVALKPCPRCHGTGRVPKPGGRRDELVEESIAWAQSWHGKLAVVTPWEGVEIPGLAIAFVDRGGWGAVKVYTPKPVYSRSRGGFTYPVTYRDCGQPFPHYKVAKRHASDLAPLVHWDDDGALEVLKMLPGQNLLEE